MSTPGTLNYPATLDDVVSLFEVTNNAITALSIAAASGDATLNVTSTSLFPTTGAITVDAEIIYYTGKTGTTFTGCLRGRDGTAAASHLITATVSGYITARHFAALRDAIIALETAAVILAGSQTISGSKTFTPGVFERGRTTALGEWLQGDGGSFSAGNYTASPGTWTVSSGQQTTYRYTLFGKTMVLAFTISSGVTASSPTHLDILIPAGLSASSSDIREVFYYSDDGATTFKAGIASPLGTKIRLFKDPNATAWANIAVFVQGQITFEIA